MSECKCDDLRVQRCEVEPVGWMACSKAARQTRRKMLTPNNNNYYYYDDDDDSSGNSNNDCCQFIASFGGRRSRIIKSEPRQARRLQRYLNCSADCQKICQLIHGAVGPASWRWSGSERRAGGN